ncbi:hypothetical protein [Desulfosporosinus metallidurans]|uniref:Uncharacterized protein n=1 Tax=Desulfosporosinus metallidurans TaxID=1888891 RepID=A0A1Q8QSJ4_9FIRM|nr:hypothetical protein [Desulfosporosinus metallidurans]OLN30319.1 hypothetical protein DSOL_3084 [Desulfosporosinus metallidurans]
MKENNLWLSPEEIQHMLQGSLQWLDVAPRITTSKTGIRKLGDAVLEKELAPKQTEPIGSPAMEKSEHSKPLKGKPVIWLLGSVGLLTLSSWFYFVIFAN